MPGCRLVPDPVIRPTLPAQITVPHTLPPVPWVSACDEWSRTSGARHPVGWGAGRRSAAPLFRSGWGWRRTRSPRPSRTRKADPLDGEIPLRTTFTDSSGATDSPPSTTRTGSTSRCRRSPTTCRWPSSRWRTAGSTSIRASTGGAPSGRCCATPSPGRTAQGGSTLTQQYVKNYLYLVEAKTEAEKADAIATTPIRKLREAKMALQPRTEPEQGRDPRAVPEPGRLRAVPVRRRGRVPVVLRHVGGQADAGPGRPAGRHGQQPAQVQPAGREPCAGRPGPARPGAGRHGRRRSAVQGDRRGDQEAGPGPEPEPHPERLHPGRQLARPTASSASTRSTTWRNAGFDAETVAAGRLDDQDHAGPGGDGLGEGGRHVQRRPDGARRRAARQRRRRGRQGRTPQGAGAGREPAVRPRPGQGCRPSSG